MLSDKILNLLSVRHVAREMLTTFNFLRVSEIYSLIRNSMPYQYHKRQLTYQNLSEINYSLLLNLFIFIKLLS